MESPPTHVPATLVTLTETVRLTSMSVWVRTVVEMVSVWMERTTSLVSVSLGSLETCAMQRCKVRIFDLASIYGISLQSCNWIWLQQFNTAEGNGVSTIVTGLIAGGVGGGIVLIIVTLVIVTTVKLRISRAKGSIPHQDLCSCVSYTVSLQGKLVKKTSALEGRLTLHTVLLFQVCHRCSYILN